MASLNASLQLPALQGTSVQNDEGVGSSQLRQHSSHSHSHPSNVVTMASTITTDLGKAMQRRHKNKELARRSRLRKRLDFLLLLLQRYSVNLHLFLNIHGNRITELPFVATDWVCCFKTYRLYVDALNSKATVLQDENTQLRSEIEHFNSLNCELQKQISQFENLGTTSHSRSQLHRSSIYQ
jgi:hypothetical protein